MVVGVVEVTALRIACIAVLLLLLLLPPWWTSLDTCDTVYLQFTSYCHNLHKVQGTNFHYLHYLHTTGLVAPLF